jgi:hypothetical protein
MRSDAVELGPQLAFEARGWRCAGHPTKGWASCHPCWANGVAGSQQSRYLESTARRSSSVACAVGDRCLSLADQPGDDHMTNAVHALPGEVLFHVEVIRQEMRTIKSAPHDEVLLPLKRWRRRSISCLKRQAGLPRPWLPKSACSSAAAAAVSSYLMLNRDLRGPACAQFTYEGF